MTELIQKAIDKIDKEAEKLNNSAVTIISSHIIDKHLKSDFNAQRVLEDKKTLKECWDEVTKKAKKQASGGCAVVSDDTVFDWVNEYYEFEDSNESSSDKFVNLFDCL